MTMITPIEGACVWHGRDIAASDRWVRTLEPAHVVELEAALAAVEKIAPTMGRDQLIVLNLSGRGDKDIFTVAEALGVRI